MRRRRVSCGLYVAGNVLVPRSLEVPSNVPAPIAHVLTLESASEALARLARRTMGGDLVRWVRATG